MTVQQYHIMLKSLVFSAIKRITLLFKQNASHKQIRNEIARWQLQGYLLGSQAAHDQLDEPTARGHVALPNVIVAAGITFGMATVLARTFIISAYRKASISAYAANDVDSWIWVADGPHPCPFCTRMNGTVHPVTEEFKSHDNCYCTTVPQVGDQATMAMTV